MNATKAVELQVESGEGNLIKRHPDITSPNLAIH